MDFLVIETSDSMDKYLKFPDAQTALSAMKEAGYTQEVGGTNPMTGETTPVKDIICGNGDDLVHDVGTIYKLTGTFGDIVSTPMDGYHVNIKTLDLQQSLTQYIVTPKTPRNVWA